MRSPRSIARAMALAAALSIAALAGCGDDEAVDPDDQGDNYISANTPINGVRRVMATYEARDRASYLLNLTNDFRFIFSPASDPDLVLEYGETWDLAREDLSTRHLYEGFTDGLGTYHPPVVRIDSDFLSASVSPDPRHPDSTDHYQIVDVPLLGIIWEIEGDPNDVYGIESDYMFSFVRGDAAQLRAGQPADSTRWYLYRIEDFTGAGVARPVPHTTMPGTPVTWGSIRAAYL